MTAPAASCWLGVKTMERPSGETAGEPVIRAPFCDTASAFVTVPGFTGTLVYNVTSVFAGTPVAPFAGRMIVTWGVPERGCAMVENTERYGFERLFPLRSRTPVDTDTVTVELYGSVVVSVTVRLSLERATDAFRFV